jgi:hypothetical protein
LADWDPPKGRPISIVKGQLQRLDFRLKRNANFSMIACNRRRDAMKFRAQGSKSSSTFSRPICLNTKTWRYLEPIFEALHHGRQQSGRFKFYGYLEAVYRTYKEWRELGISQKMARHVGKYFKIPHRKGTTPVRTLIDATFPDLDPKQKSRWSRALEYAALAKVTAENLPRLFKSHSGITGCACLAAKKSRERTGIGTTGFERDQRC